MMKIVLAMLCAALAAATSPPIGPGMRFRVTQHTMDETVKVINLFLDTLQSGKLSEILKKSRPEGSGIQDVEVLKTEMPEIKLGFAPPNMIVGSVSGGDVEVLATVKEGDKEGKIRGVAKGLKGQAKIEFSKNEENKLKLSLAECSMDIETAELKPEGFDDELQGTMEEKLSGLSQQGKAAVSSLLCPQMEMAIMAATSKIAMEPTEKLLDLPSLSGFVIDTHLMTDPKATTDYLEFDISGCVHKQGAECGNYVPRPLVDKSDNSRMLIGFVADEMVNKLLRELHESGYMKSDLTDEAAATLKEELLKVKNELNLDIMDNDDFTFTLGTLEGLEAPSIEFVDEDEDLKKRQIVWNAKAELDCTQHRDGEILRTVAVYITAQGDLKLGFVEVEGKNAPDLDIQSTIKSISIDDITGATQDITDLQKDALAARLKDLIQQRMDNQMMRLKEARKEKYAKIEEESPGRITNVYLKGLTHTLEGGMDYVFDKEKMMEKIAAIKVPGGFLKALF